MIKCSTYQLLLFVYYFSYRGWFVLPLHFILLCVFASDLLWLWIKVFTASGILIK